MPEKIIIICLVLQENGGEKVLKQEGSPGIPNIRKSNEEGNMKKP